jgi:hypothetical protein
MHGQQAKIVIRQLRDNLEPHALLLDAYAVSNNRFHLFLFTPRANLSQLMERLNMSYALCARYKHQHYDDPCGSIRVRFADIASGGTARAHGWRPTDDGDGPRNRTDRGGSHGRVAP